MDTISVGISLIVMLLNIIFFRLGEITSLLKRILEKQ